MKRFAVALIACVVILAALGSVAGAQSSKETDIDRLYHAFIDPPRDFSPMPFWFWNGKMNGALIKQQIRDMLDQHVYGAFAEGRDELQTPYLSDSWFEAIGAGLEQAKKSGFEFNFLDEYDWPSGEVRNIWMAGHHQTEILARRPDFRMKTIAYDAKVIAPQSICGM